MPNLQLAGVLSGASLLAAAVAGTAHAAALEQVVPATVRLLYQDGRYAEFGFSFSDPHQSGNGATIPAGFAGPAPMFVPGNTGDLFESRWNFAGAYRADLTERISYALIFDQPYGADTSYGAGSFPALLPNGDTLYQGSLADMKTYQITAAVAYDVTSAVKVYGGLRAERLDAKAAIPFLGGYSVDAGKNWGYGWLIGTAYERPEIALRVALTYQSKISHDLDTRETSALAGTVDTNTDVDTPQSATLEFQTGVAPGTLVFGSIRWVDWSEFSISPPLYGETTAALLGAPRPLVEYGDDWWTYTLGLGRQLTDELAGSFSVSYEPSVGGVMTTLGPYDGRTTATAALSYDWGQASITGGITYGRLGDTTNLLDTDFDDGWVWGAGLRVGYTF